MAGRSDIQAGRAYVELYVKNSALVKGLQASENQLASWSSAFMNIGAKMAGIGTAVIAPMAGAVSYFVSAGSALNDMSNRTGVAATTLAEYGYAAEQTGASLEDVEAALRKMAKNGFDVSKFDEIGAAIAAIPDPTMRAARAMEVFGKGGTAILPMLDNLAELRAEAKALGLAPTNAAVDAADKLGDTIDQAKSVAKAAMMEIGSSLAPILQPMAESIRSVLKTVKDWTSANGELIRKVALVAAGVTAIGTAVLGVGVGLGVASMMAGLLAGIITTTASIITALASPAALAGVAVGALIVSTANIGSTLKDLRGTVDDTFGFFSDMAQEMESKFGKAWKAIVGAVQSGDLRLAAEVAWAAIKLAWAEGKAVVMDYWSTMLENMKTNLSTWVQGIAGWFLEIPAMIEKSFIMLRMAVRVQLDQIMASLRSVINSSGFLQSIIYKHIPLMEKKGELPQGATDTIWSALDNAGPLNQLKILGEAAKDFSKVDANTNAAKSNLAQDFAIADEARMKGVQADIEAREKRLQELRDELNRVSQAAIETSDDKIAKRNRQLGEDIGKGSAMVTFSAAAAGMIGGGVAEKHLEESKKHTSLLDKLVRSTMGGWRVK